MARKHKAKRILQLRDGGLSRAAIARSTGRSKQSVCDVFDVAEEQGITYDAIRDMPDDGVYRLISPDRNNHEPAYCSPDREHVHRELPIRQGVCGLVEVTLREQELVDGLIAEVGHVRVPDPHIIGGIEGVCDPMLAEPPSSSRSISSSHRFSRFAAESRRVSSRRRLG